MTSSTSFPLFSSLPIELRLKIWALNLPGPRLVPLHYTSTIRDPSNPSSQKELRGCTSPTSIPINLYVNKEARSHALKKYQLSFNLPHRPPKIWFNAREDILYFPAKEGWLGSWNHFVNTVTMIGSVELGKVKRLAVHEALFRGVRGTSSSPNVQATCMREFWEYVRRKFGNVEELTVLVERNLDGQARDEEMELWMESVLGCVLSKDEIRIGSLEERLVEGLETGLRFVEKNGWKAPKWDVLGFPGDSKGAGIAGWPTESVGVSHLDFGGRDKEHAMLNSIIIPHLKADSKAIVKEEQSFWMGGQLPLWYYLAEV